jgi:hypothetical protein
VIDTLLEIVINIFIELIPAKVVFYLLILAVVIGTCYLGYQFIT